MFTVIDRKRFVRRRPELLALEGWYDIGSYKFKFSCRYNDILRCSEFLDKPEHFHSCFGKDGGHAIQPILRCLDRNWAIVYTPDQHGNFMGRAFAHWIEARGPWAIAGVQNDFLEIDKRYGNRLNVEDICLIMKKLNVECRTSGSDTYLSSGLL